MVGARRRLPRRLVRARRRRSAQGARRGRPCVGAPRRQDRDARGGGLPDGDRPGGRRDDGRPRRPRHRVPAGGRAPPAEADHPPLRRGRRPGDHRDADDGEHDHRPVADARRGERRRQRRVRRHRRADAQRRDGHRRRPGRRRRRRWSPSPTGPRRRPATASGAAGSDGAARTSGPTAGPDHDGDHPRRRARRGRQRGGGDPVLHPLGSQRTGDGPVPPDPAADRPVARPGHRAGDGAVVGRHAAEGRHLHLDRRDGLVRRRAGRRAAATSRRATSCSSSPVRPTGRSGASTDVLRLVRVA